MSIYKIKKPDVMLFLQIFGLFLYFFPKLGYIDFVHEIYYFMNKTAKKRGENSRKFILFWQISLI